MPKKEKVKVNVAEKVVDNICDLSLTGLTEVPVRDIATFKRVTILDLSSNGLVSLGRQFTTLTRIVKLDLSKNQLKFLPDEFGLLNSLRHLDLFDNKLEHLPLSFGTLSNLRYLDLKGNPLKPKLKDIVGPCLTAKECQMSAKNIVNFMLYMREECEKVRTQNDVAAAQAATETNNGDDGGDNEDKVMSLKSAIPKKSIPIKPKKKSSQYSNDIVTDINPPILSVGGPGGGAGGGIISKSASGSDDNEDGLLSGASSSTSITSHSGSSTSVKSKKLNVSWKKPSTMKAPARGSVALTSILIFFALLSINILIIYLMMFKYPDIGDRVVEMIPHQYRDWLQTKTAIFRFRVTDLISKFQTSPEEQ